jgi:N-acetylmuramoyl-L-alanine amidase
MRFIKIALFFVATVLIYHSNLYAQNDKPFTVVIDAGHGGKDPGNRGNKYYEKKNSAQCCAKNGCHT